MRKALLILLLFIPIVLLGQFNGGHSYRTAVWHDGGGSGDYTDLVGQWSFDESSGSPQDSHGSDHGTATDVIYGATGKVNDAYDFERGDDAYVTITGTNFGSGDAAMCMWVNIESFGATYYVIGGDVGALSWSILDDGRMILLENGGNVSGTTTMAIGTGTLTFIAFVYDNAANTVKFWINNATEIEGFSNTSFESETTTIGARLTTAFSFDGIIDELYIYDAAVADTIINYNYYKGLEGKGYGE